mgnify:FL=1
MIVAVSALCFGFAQQGLGIGVITVMRRAALGWAMSAICFGSQALAAGTVSECTQEALESAIEGGGAVDFACGPSITLTSALNFQNIEVSIDGLTDDGNITLIADGETRLVTIEGTATVTLGNLVLSGGSSTQGGAVRNFGTLTLSGVEILDSTSSTVGGGIQNGGVLIASDVRFEGNTAESVGGGLYNAGLATLTRVSLIGNTVGGVGGAIDSVGRLTLVNATVAGNVGGGQGAIRLSGSNASGSLLSHVTITDNRLTDEASNAAAGLVVGSDSAVSVLNTVIAGNGMGGQCNIIGTLAAVDGSVASDASCTGFTVADVDAINLGEAVDQVGLGSGLQTVYPPALPTVLLDAAADDVCGDDAVGGVDQLGQTRPLAEACDVGAVELDVNRPVVDLNGSAGGRNVAASYAETAEAVVVAPAVTVTGGDLELLQRAEVVLTELNDPGAETLAVDVGATALTAAYDAQSGVMTLTGEAAPEDYAAVLATLSYRYDGEILGDTTRVLSVRVFGATLDSSASRVTLTLQPINDAPVAGNDAYAVSADAVFIVDAPGLLANDSDADQQTLRASGPSTSPGGASLVISGNGRMVYDPVTAYLGLAEGVVVEDVFTYFVADTEGASAEGEVVMTVTGVNDPPVANNDRFSLTEDGIVSSPAPGVLANDSDPDSGDSLQLVSADATTSSGLPVTVGSDGSVAFDPTGSAAVQGLRQGQVQIETLQYTIADSAGSQASAELRFDIQGRNDAPVAVALGQEHVFVDEAAVVAVGAAFSDADAGDTLTFTTSGLPSSLSLGTINGQITGTPSEADIGRYMINIVATDTAGASASTPLVLIVERVGNDAPYVVDAPEDQELDEGEAFSLTLGEVFEDPDGDTLSFAVTGLPEGLEFSGDAVTGAPAFQSAGSYVVELTATDPSGASTDVAFTLTVTEPERDVAVSVTPAASIVEPETPFTWTVEVSNPGDATAGGAVILQVSGAGLSVDVPTGCSRSVGVQTVTLDCDVGAIQSGGAQQIEVVTEADRAGGVWLQARAGDLTTDLNPEDNLASNGVIVTELLAEVPGVEFAVSGGTRLAVLDADGDGSPDVAVGSEAGSPTRIYRQQASDDYELDGSLGDVGEVAGLIAGEFDGLTGEDLLVVNASGGHALYVNDGSGAFVLSAAAFTGTEGLDALGADLDEDGVGDVLMLHADAVPEVLFTEGEDGFFTVLLEPADAISIGLADIDGDGRPEPVFGLADGDVFQPTIGRRSFGPRVALPTAGVTHWAGGDLDGDGDGDLLAAVPETLDDVFVAPELRMLRALSRNAMEIGTRADIGVTRRLVMADIDRDGDLDVVSASPNGVVQLLVNDGGGRLRPHDTAIDADAVDMALADMDGDGDTDLVLLLAEQGAVQIWFNQGDLVFSDTVGSPRSLHDDDGSGALGLWALLLLVGAAVWRRARVCVD